MSQSSSSSALEEHRLGTNLCLAIDEAILIVDGLTNFPVDVSFSAFAVIDGRGSSVKTKPVTLYRSDPGLMEQIHENLSVKINEEIPEEERKDRIVVKDIRMTVKRKNKVVQKCPCCHAEVKTRMLLHLKERCPVSKGKYCMNCASMVEGDLMQHIIECRSRKYHCVSCGEEFLHSSTLRAHQSTCRAIRRAEQEVSSCFSRLLLQK